MSPTPKRQDMVPCPHCGAENDPNRGSNRCRSCQLPLSEKTPLTPEQRALRAKLASHTFWASLPDPADRRKHTAKARRKSPVSLEYWLDRVPEDITDPAARLKAAESSHKAHMTRLAYASARARANRKNTAA